MCNLTVGFVHLYFVVLHASNRHTQQLMKKSAMFACMKTNKKAHFEIDEHFDQMWIQDIFTFTYLFAV